MLEDYGVFMPFIIGGGLMALIGGAALISNYRKGYDGYTATEDYLKECRKKELREKGVKKLQL